MTRGSLHRACQGTPTRRLAIHSVGLRRRLSFLSFARKRDQGCPEGVARAIRDVPSTVKCRGRPVGRAVNVKLFDVMKDPLRNLNMIGAAWAAMTLAAVSPASAQQWQPPAGTSSGSAGQAQPEPPYQAQAGPQPGYAQPAPPQGQPLVTIRVPIFVDVIGGGWIPMPGVFAENHKPGPAVDVMVGLSLEPLIHQGVDVFVDAMWSQQELQERAWIDSDHTRTVVVAGCVGLRWFLFAPTGIGAPYILAGAGLVYETAEATTHHDPPKPSWMTMGGVGWEVPLGSVVRVGARVTGTYLDEDGARLGWLAPSITLGLEL